MARIGFIGLGNMGLPMAGNLVKGGHKVKGFDVVQENLNDAVTRHIAIAQSAAEASSDVDIVITMLPSGRETLFVYDNAGTLDAAASGTIFIDCSTIDVASAHTAHDLAGKAGKQSLDCPVSGGVSGAEGATLTIMAGGSAETFTAAKPVLECMAGKVIHCGGPGAGQSAKICNNMILGISMIGVSEAFVLAEKLGLSKQALFDVASNSSGQCWSLTTYCPVPGLVETSPANNDYKPGFAANLMLKDLKLSQEAAAANGVKTALGAHATDLYAEFAGDGHGGEDFSAIVKFIRDAG